MHSRALIPGQAQHRPFDPATDFDPATAAAARQLVARALAEDLAYGPDATSAATIPASASTTARIVSREAGVLAGLPTVAYVLDELLGAGTFTLDLHCADGDTLTTGDTVATITAPTRDLLTAERTLLNLLCHLSGVATATRQWVDAVAGTPCVIRDTRKTLPGMRLLQKYAVRAGGGANHRLGLGDALLVKDNHVAAAGGITAAIEAVRATAAELPLEVEVDSFEQLDEALAAGVQLVLLDNFPLWQVQTAVQRRDRIHPATLLEASGRLQLDTAADIARTGVDFLAIGALTHSVRVCDLGLDL